MRTCRVCRGASGDNGDPSLCENRGCPYGSKNVSWPSSQPPVTGFEYRKAPNGHFYVGFKGDIDNNHWHLAPDGTVLAVKEGGNHLFRRTDVTQKIQDVCPQLNISFLWKG